MSSPPNKVLITGGAGFIGSHLARALTQRGAQVRILDDLSSGSQENLSGLDVDFHQGDVTCRVTADKACEGIDQVYHLAANASVALSMHAPLECHRVNTLGTLVMHEAAKRAHAKSFVFCSSCAVYGDASSPIREDFPTAPLSPYAAAKLSSEVFLTSCASAKTKIRILRLFNVFGPKQNPNGPYAAVIPAFMRAFNAGQAPTIFGDGEQTRDFVYISDVVDALLKAAEIDGPDALTVNIGSGRATTLLELAQILASACGKNNQPEFHPARPGDIRHSTSRIEQASKLLNWKPQVSLEDGLAEVVKA